VLLTAGLFLSAQRKNINYTWNGD